MDLLFIMRDALGSSILGGLKTAIEAKKAGREVGVLLTQEALAAAARGCFAWPRELSGQQARWTIADRASAAELPVRGRGESRQVDVPALLSKAREAGVALYACPVWTELLELDGKLPQMLSPVDAAGLPGLLERAKKIVGTL